MLTVEDRLLVQELYTKYNHAFDAADAEAWAALFTKDGVFAGREIVVGRENIRMFAVNQFAIKDKQPFRNAQHWNSNIMLERDGDKVRGSCYLARLAQDPASSEFSIISLGKYIDEIVQIDGEWRFARRTFVW